MKKIAAIFVISAMLLTRAAALVPVAEDAVVITSPSAVLMEKTTGEIIYEKNAHERLAPASVTKVMTLLLVVEEIESGALSEDDVVTTSTRASSMGGSQIWLREGEQMTVREMLKALTVVSANDCAVALAEHIAGSEDAFVGRMNERARELGMTDTVFADCTGLLESPEHLTSAYDIALMSRELILHDMVKDYTTIWMEELRGGKTQLNNTNKLIHGFPGATGLKTGFTRRAMYCLSATAERGGVEYIAVVMHDETSNDRFDSARALLNYAFANYELARIAPTEPIPPVTVSLGNAGSVQPVPLGAEHVLVPRGDAANVRVEIALEERVRAPITQGQQLGVMTARSGDEVIAEIPLVSEVEISALGRWQIFRAFLGGLVGGM